MKIEHFRFLAALSSAFRDGALQHPVDAHGSIDQGSALYISRTALGVSAAQQAFLLATLSGLSLPLGALLGLRVRPNDGTCSGWIAVGAGALLFAVSVELYAHAIHEYTMGRMDPAAMVVLMVVSVFGSIFFTWTTRLLEGEQGEEEEFEAEEDCPACGHSAPDGAFFCYRCGERLLRHGPLPSRAENSPLVTPRLISPRIISPRRPMPPLSLSGPAAAALLPGVQSGGPMLSPRTHLLLQPRRQSSPAPVAPWTRRQSSTASFGATSGFFRQRSPGGGPRRGSCETPGSDGSSIKSPRDRDFVASGARPLARPQGMGAMLRAAKAQERERARWRWKRLREAVMLMQVIRYLQGKAAAARAARRAERLASKDSCISMETWAADDIDITPPVSARSTGRKSSMSELEVSRVARDFFEDMKKAFASATERNADLYTAVESYNMSQHRTGALKMYMVLLVDGIPEGILMGFLAAEGSLSITLVLSFLIANFPEAFAGGVLMEKGGFARWQIVALWGGLMLMIGVLAGVSCDILLLMDPEFTGETHVPFKIQLLVSVMEGLAGGAMISGIAGTMLPEAYERRNKTGWMITSGGFLCTLGFLTSVGIKITSGAFN